MYENACQLMAKQSVALEVLSFHATAQFEESTFLSVSVSAFILLRTIHSFVMIYQSGIINSGDIHFDQSSRTLVFILEYIIIISYSLKVFFMKIFVHID